MNKTRQVLDAFGLDEKKTATALAYGFNPQSLTEAQRLKLLLASAREHGIKEKHQQQMLVLAFFTDLIARASSFPFFPYLQQINETLPRGLKVNTRTMEQHFFPLCFERYQRIKAILHPTKNPR